VQDVDLVDGGKEGVSSSRSLSWAASVSGLGYRIICCIKVDF